MSDLTLVLPTPKLTLMGFSDKGAFVTLGTLPLYDPTAREEIIEATFEYIKACQKEGSMCKIATFLFYPEAFDFFTVQ